VTNLDFDEQSGDGHGWNRLRQALAWLAGVALLLLVFSVHAAGQASAAQVAAIPPKVAQAERFLAQRGLTPEQARWNAARRPQRRFNAANAIAETAGTAAWTAVGPTAVTSQSYGLVTGRITALALDPSDTTGNHLYVGATGGGVWRTVNGAANTSSVSFSPLTDTLSALSGITDASISIGALTVQPGGTGVILAGTGDPNDALDSYYGAGILRSADGGNTWSLIIASADEVQGQSSEYFRFLGEGFAGFAWSTRNQQLVVAAVSQAYEGVVVDAVQSGTSYEGLYYSTDSGVTWHLATITDGGGVDVQGPSDSFTLPDGNAATSVVWNPVRQMFIAAVRYHGYYQSTDGMTFTRMANQPGAGLTAAACPTNSGQPGSSGCPIFRGSLAVNPSSGDTFAWTVDIDNQDQGLWQDQCEIGGGVCTTQTITFGQQWTTTALEENDFEGPATIVNGDYNLALAAVPSEQDTILLAGDTDLWRCSLALGCPWRNTTNSTTCMSAKVGEYQHALAWDAANPLEIFAGNDSGLWRSLDAIGETGSACASTDASHFQNLNGSLGSLAEVVSLAQSSATPDSLLAGLGANGTAGVKGTTAPPADWPEILGGEGGPVEIDPTNNANWYANNQAGVSIYLCAQTSACTPSVFGSTPLINDTDTGDDGFTMTTPAPFLVDPLNATELLIATCRIWRGPASGSGWSSANAISPILDGSNASSCEGDPLIRSIAALPLAGGSEVIYVGMYGSLDGGSILPGHVFSATYTPGSSAPVWQDLTSNPVTNDTVGINQYGFDISSIVIDSHDPTGNTVYITVEGEFVGVESRIVYRSTDGGAHWANLTANLPIAPANSLAVDPGDANTVYLALDTGVYSTRTIATCATASSTCWTAFGTGLPESPVVVLSATPAGSTAQQLLAATYGRGIWENALWTAGVALTTATVSPTSLTFSSQVLGTSSASKTVTITNKGTKSLLPTAIAMSGDFSQTNTCVGQTIAANATCTVKVIFTPTSVGNRTGQMALSANVSGGQLTAALTGTGASAGAVNLSPTAINFGPDPVGTTSATEQVTANNAGGTAVSITSVKATSPFAIASNACGTSIAATSSCVVLLDFLPTASGAASGTLTFTDGAGTQTVALSGTGQALATDTLSETSQGFPNTVIGQASAALPVTLTNNGDLPLQSIGTSVTGNFSASSNCGTSLAGHSSCAISVTFLPQTTGALTGTLVVSDAIRAQNVALSGRGVLPPAFTLSPTSMSFVAIEVGFSSNPRQLTITNSGGAPMANVGFQFTGANPGNFSTGGTTCGATLTNGSNCVVNVTFSPTTVGGSTATLVVTSSTPGVTPALLKVSGTGLAPPQFNANPTSLSFNNVILGNSSGAEQVMIANTGGVGVTDMQLAATGDFAPALGTCTVALAAGTHCYATVTFTPTALGARTGILTISSTSGEAQPITVSLSGVGVAAASIVGNKTELDFGSISQGQVSTTQKLSITDVGTLPMAGLTFTATAPFQLSQNQCSTSLAAEKSCSMLVDFAPTAVGSQTGTLTIASTTAGVVPLVVVLTGTGVAAPTLAVNPQALTFGGVLVGGSSTAINVVVSNPGAATLAGLALTISGNFSLSGNTCGASLAAAASCSANVIFKPQSTGTLTGTLSVTSTSNNVAPVAVPLTGTGLGPGAMVGTPSNINFGSLTVGFTSGVQSATILNTGTVEADGLQFHVAGDFSLPANTCGASLGAGLSCTVSITFSPSTTGSRTGSIALSSTTAGVGSATIALSGNGLPSAYLAASPATVSFPGTAQGIVSSPILVALSDPGVAAVSGIQMQVSGDFSATLCNTTLSPEGGTCNVSVTFNPAAQGSLTGKLTFTSSQPGVPALVVPLSGTGTPPPSLSLNPTSLSFPGTATGSASVAQTITVSNPGTAPLNTPSMQVSGDFQVTANGCTTSVVAGGSCTVQVEFAPTEVGGRTGTLTVSTTTAGVESVSASLSGTGLTPAAFSASPLQFSFPVVLVGQSSPAQTVTVKNTGGAAAASTTLTVNSDQFAITNNNCPSSLAAGASCTAGVIFQPTFNGAQSASLSVTSPSVANPASVALTGTGGTPAALSPLPGLLTFSSTGVGLTSSPQTVTITNPGVLTATGVALAAAAPFQLVNNTCTATLAAQASCTTGVVFAPTSAGAQQGALTLSGTAGSGASASPLSATVALAGTGFDFTVQFQGVSSQSVSSGQTADYKLVIDTLNGSQGSFTFQSANLPPNAICTFNPTTEAITAAAAGNVAAEIATGQSLASSRPNAPAVSSGWERMVPFLCVLLLAPLGWKRRRRALLLVALLGVLVSGVSSCLGSSGGGGGSTGGQGGGKGGSGTTPAGTYSIPITVISTGVQHKVTVTLVVD
jgi:hypothetical protein